MRKRINTWTEGEVTGGGGGGHLGGVMVSMLPIGPTFADSNPAEAMDF
jgi:hypothetical protein